MTINDLDCQEKLLKLQAKITELEALNTELATRLDESRIAYREIAGIRELQVQLQDISGVLGEIITGINQMAHALFPTENG